ncbi:MAG: hypothetical protein OEY67_01530 [Gammaproteobacteria bacterium]|nr:hypothetical protein [Gammaproteobacteria bacterium]
MNHFKTLAIGLITITLIITSGCGATRSEEETSTAANPGGLGTDPDPGSSPPPPAINSVVLTWDGPRTNANGSTLRDLAGYKIYMSTVSGQYDATKVVAVVPASPTGGGSERFQKDNLASGTYYFVVSAYDSAVPPNESIFSGEASKTIP